MPEPRKGEEKNEYMGRCIRVLKSEGKYDEKQRIAICLNMWSRANESVVTTDIEKNTAKGYIDVIGGKKKKKKKDVIKRIDKYLEES